MSVTMHIPAPNSFQYLNDVSISKVLDAERTYIVQILKVDIDIYPFYRYNSDMIKNFSNKETEKIYRQQFSRKLPQSIQKIALRKLIMLYNATCMNDLRIPPSNHLEQLSGNRDGEYSIRINKQYRICFTLAGTNDFINVGIEDYH